MISRVHSLSRRQIAEALNEVAPHATPISSALHLKGRAVQLRDVEQAIYAAGRHVFIHGERGVGKTSLAKTAGLANAESAKHFRQIGCSTDATFQDLMQLILEVFSPESVRTVSKESGWNISYILGIASKQSETKTPPELTASQAADLLANLDAKSSVELKVVVIDETDRIASDETRRQLAELVKLLGDRGSRLTLVFTGVGEDLQAILGHHPSSFRQLAQIHLKRLEYQAALDIVDDVLGKFGLNWELEPVRTIRFRVASIANGFPYYVHLLMEKLIYAIFDDRSATVVTADHMKIALQSAVQEAAEEIRKPYDRATRGRAAVYKHVVWAMADSWDLERDTNSVYRSYREITQQVGETPVTQKRVTQILSSLKRPTYGSLLSSGYRKGQYEFTENIVRGYVRLCAEAEGVELLEAMPYEPPSVTARVREKRYVDPRRIGGPPPTW